MSKTAKKSEEAKSKVPSDVGLAPDEVVTLYAVVPCRPGGFRVISRACLLEDVCDDGTVGDCDTGLVAFSSADWAIRKQATR